MIEFTYTKILENLKSNLSKRLGNSGLLFFSTNQRILEAVAEELSELMRYNEYLTNEAKWSTAQNISSLVAQADFFGYVPHRKVGAVGELTVSSSRNFNGSWLYQIDIPKFSQFYNGEYYFASYKDISLFPTEVKTKIPVVQGLVRHEEFPTSMYNEIELSDFSITIENDSIENEIFEVKVNDILWRQVSHFGESLGQDDLIYRIKTTLDFSGVIVIFGNGLNSKKIESGDLIEVTYLETAGEYGEILRTNNVTQVISSFKDINNSPVALYCTNEKEITGGREIESLESIREKAPLTFTAGNALVTRQDYLSALLNTKIPDKVTVWGEIEQNEDHNRPTGTFIPLYENLIYVSGLTISDITQEALPLTESQQNRIQEILAPKKSLTDIIQYVDPKITYFDVYTHVRYDRALYSAEAVHAQVVESLMAKYSITNLERHFKENLYFSQYYEFINALDSVLYHETDITLFQITTPKNEAGYFFNIDLGHALIRAQSIKIYIRNISESLSENHPYSFKQGWTHIATDDGLGSFESETIIAYGEVGDPDMIPDVGSTFEVYSTTSIDSISYKTGTFKNAIGELLKFKINKGIPANWHNSLQIKIEFKIGDSQISILPINRNQIFGIQNVIALTEGTN